MLRFLSDENFNNDIVKGLMLLSPAIDIVRVQDVGLKGKHDREILSWATGNNRIILTHDRASMEYHAYHQLSEFKKVSGVFIIHDQLSIGEVVKEIDLINVCSEQSEWWNRVTHIPL